MITSEMISKVNAEMKRVSIKGKPYATVAARVAAFRNLCPTGRIITEIIVNEPGMVMMRAHVYDDENSLLATGTAYEREGANYINKTSYIEVCETSAVGRALGFLGIGSDDDITSAEELAAAIQDHKHQEDNNGFQEAPFNPDEMATDKERELLETEASKVGITCSDQTIKNWPNITKAQYATCMKSVKDLLEKNENKRKSE